LTPAYAASALLALVSIPAVFRLPGRAGLRF